MQRSDFRFILLAPIVVAVLLVSNVVAQLETGAGVKSFTQREFTKADGEVLIFGHMDSLKGSTVTIIDSQGSKFEYNISVFSVADREWIRKEAAKRKKAERLEKERTKLFTQIQGGKTSTIVTACNRLRDYGDIDSSFVFAPSLKTLWNHEDKRVRQAAFIAYIFVSRKADSDYAEILKNINTNQHGAHDAMVSKPRHFLEAMGKFEKTGLTYVRHVAFTGDIKADPDSDYDDELPRAFILTKGQRNRLRVEAIKVLGQIRTEESLQALVDLLSVVQEKTGADRDQNSMKALIKAIGEIGIDDDNVKSMLEDHSDEYPELVAEAIKSMSGDDK